MNYEPPKTLNSVSEPEEMTKKFLTSNLTWEKWGNAALHKLLPLLFEMRCTLFEVIEI